MLRIITKLMDNSKGIIFLCAFRTSNFFTKTSILKKITFPIRFTCEIYFNEY